LSVANFIQPARPGQNTVFNKPTDEETDGGEEPDQAAGKRKGMCCTLKGTKAQRLVVRQCIQTAVLFMLDKIAPVFLPHSHRKIL